MYCQRSFRIAVGILVCCLLQVQGADKYTDENRPYEFGFNVEIDGSKQQHRHEKKDKDGIIMGEFGFVTADDVYHVTVYATDKEGRFKILSMKNIHLKSAPAPAGPALSARQGHSLALPASVSSPGTPAVPQAAPASKAQIPFKPISLEPPGRSCSSCSIPTTTARTPVVAPPAYSPVSAALPDNVQAGGFGTQPLNPQFGSPSPQNYPQQPALQTNPQQAGIGGPVYNTPVESYPQQAGIGGPAYNTPVDSYPQPGAQEYPNIPLAEQSPNPQSVSPGRTSKQYTGPEQQFGPNVEQPGPVKPTLVSAQMQIVDKNTNVNELRPGEKQGLPPGLNKDDMTQLLYTFNYTVGFHGHFEEGYTNGVKKGYYFVTGRNGVRTRVDYVADDSGFHPRISQDVLDLLSNDVPKPETEKDAKYGLKGYEFKWLYYPVESKRR